MAGFWVKVLVILLISVILMLLPTVVTVIIAAQYYEGNIEIFQEIPMGLLFHR